MTDLRVEDIEHEGPERNMSEDEEALSNEVYEAIMDASRYSERSLQSANFQAGISDLGFCSERLRRMLAQEVPEDTDLLPAFIGTAIGRETEAALAVRWPQAIIQPEITVVLHGDGRDYNVVGHPDVIVNDTLLDVKTARGLRLARRMGPSQSQQFQRHCYAKGAHAAGLFGDTPLEQVRVANVWLDRAADERRPYTQMEFYDPGVVEHATQWLDEVVYAFIQEEEAQKEPPREMCEATCGFFDPCRTRDTDVEGVIEGTEQLLAIEMYQEGKALEKTGKQMKDQAKAALRGVRGSTGNYTVRWVFVDGSHIEFDRRPSDRLDIRPIRKGKAK